MANTSRINGFKPVKHLTGAPYNGQSTLYEVSVSDTNPVFVGDLVKLSTNASTSGLACVTSVVAASSQITAGPILGAVVGVLNAKMDPLDGTMTGGSIALDTPQFRAASTKQFVLVSDAPDLIYEAEADAAVTLANIGFNVGLGAAAHASSLISGASPMFVYSTTTPDATSTRPLQIVGQVKRADNETAVAFNKVLVRINVHTYGSVGVAGV